MRCFVSLLLGLPNSYKPKHRLLWQGFFRLFSCRCYCPSLPALGKIRSWFTPTAAELLLHPLACGPRKHWIHAFGPVHYFVFLLCFWATEIFTLKNIFSCYILSLTPMEQGRGPYMNLQCHLTRHFLMQWNVSKKIQKEYQMLLGRDFFFSSRNLKFEISGAYSNGVVLQ